ncbi:MAG: protein kinase [Nitrospirae bacterium]|nr:protein kinase [Nitrospirota bacterium]MBF0541862.1 protein kinase [Nitrospirota bacterium]
MEKELVERVVKQVLPSYTIEEKLGEGSFGAVFKIKDALKERAVKVILLSAGRVVEKGSVTDPSEKIERDFRHIIDSYSRIECPEIVTVYDFYKVTEQADSKAAKAYAIVVMEIYPDNLLDFVINYFEKHNKFIEIDTVKILSKKLAIMLDNLHKNSKFLFEDLKPENLLIKEIEGDYKLVVGDIGGLKSIGTASATGSQVTLSYSAPEVIRKGQRPNVQSIIYSFALITFYILTGHLPYEEHGVTDRMDMIRDQGLTFDRNDVPADFKNFLSTCLKFNPEDRYKTFGDLINVLEGRPVENMPELPKIAMKKSVDQFGRTTIDLSAFKKTLAPQSSASGATVDIDNFKKETAAPNIPQIKRDGLNRTSSQRISPTQRSVNLSTILPQNLDNVTKELKGLIIRKGKIQRLKGESFKVVTNIIVEEGGQLILEEVKLYFSDTSGIICSGILTAKNSSFEASDFSKGWRNITLYTEGAADSSFEKCNFRFARGRIGKVLDSYHKWKNFTPTEGYTYGGAVFIGDTGKRPIKFQECTFFKTMTHDGGAMYSVNSSVNLNLCNFDSSQAALFGAGIYIKNSTFQILASNFKKCGAQKDGGGIYCESSELSMQNCEFTACSAKFMTGGGLYCMSSNPELKGCKFISCSASKGGGISCIKSNPNLTNIAFIECSATENGALHCDDQSFPVITFPSFSKCTPNDTNFDASKKKKTGFFG